ncbi:MAG: Uncharacterised protein [Rhodospirillaceae bacterium]|nr:MAG: Uncharacterised protein [Rhodospirillaceae bacterium]
MLGTRLSLSLSLSLKPSFWLSFDHGSRVKVGVGFLRSHGGIGSRCEIVFLRLALGQLRAVTNVDFGHGAGRFRDHVGIAGLGHRRGALRHGGGGCRRFSKFCQRLGGQRRLARHPGFSGVGGHLPIKDGRGFGVGPQPLPGSEFERRLLRLVCRRTGFHGDTLVARGHDAGTVLLAAQALGSKATAARRVV